MISHTGIAAFAPPKAFAKARHRIILHAAVYGNFASSSETVHALETALSRPGFERLDAVSLVPDTSDPHIADFLRVLRRDWSTEEIIAHFHTSEKFLRGLAKKYPEKVRLYELRGIPSMPVVITDDTIQFGHYAHSPVAAPQGFWFRTEANISALLQWTQAGTLPPDAAPETLAAFRVVSECAWAMNTAATISPEKGTAC